MSEDSKSLPLDGITVVSCEQAVAAPFATRQLADLGARVIKVERPGVGDFARGYDETVHGMASHFVWLNRGKESFVADLKNPDDLAVVRSMIDQADVFVQNLAPGAAERLGLGADELRQGHERLITVSISGYGSEGPYKDSKAYDALIQAETGLISVTGTEKSPAKTGISTADISAGMYAFSSVLTALYARERTGHGNTVEVSLFDSLMEWMGYPLYFSRYGGTRPVRAGVSHAAIAPYGVFRVGDGSEFMIAIQNDREWTRFTQEVLELPELATDERFARATSRYKYSREITDLIETRFHSLTEPDVERMLTQSQIAHSRQRDMTEVADHPQLLERNRWVPVDSPVGRIEALLPPAIFSGIGYRMDPIPSVGQHTLALRAEFEPSVKHACADQAAEVGN